jgi:SAM-dependent methyltransferase
MRRLSRWLKRIAPGARPPTAAATWLSKSLLYYPRLRADIEGSFVPSAPREITPSLVARIKTSYRLAIERFKGVGDSVWSVFSERSRDIHESLLAPSNERITQVLEDPIPTSLFNGYYSVTRDLSLDEDSRGARKLREWSIHQSVECFLRLAQATGATRLWNPERLHPERDGETPFDSASLEALLAELDKAIGIRIDFPNPLPREFGLPTSRGIASYRTAHAIYQAWRTRELLRDTKGTRVLEIGAGMGRNAYYAKRLGIGEFTIVDLPLANVAQANFLGRVLGPDAIWMPGDAIADQSGRVRICPPDWLESSDEQFDVVLNVDSITEMDSEHAISYLRDISRRAKLLLSINHEANPISTRELLSQCAIEARRLRYPYWLRRGYAEEIFFF